MSSETSAEIGQAVEAGGVGDLGDTSFLLLQHSHSFRRSAAECYIEALPHMTIYLLTTILHTK